MVWIFALGIIWLSLIHEGFRKVVFWALGVGAGVLAFALINIALH